MPEFTLSEINAMTEDGFIAAFGTVFEHSPWIARAAWRNRPFADLPDLHGKMCRVLREAPLDAQLGVIVAHPDLGERLAPLTAESVSEQAAAGLDALSAGELAAFHSNNAAYKAKFGFPFVICARLNDKDKMLAAFAARLGNDRREEIETAVGQIELIAKLRLQNLIPNP